MKSAKGTSAVLVGCVMLLCASGVSAQDWPQWRGPNRDGKATGFKAPKAWPKELTQKWKVTVGDGVATPALVGDKLFVFTRQEKNEIIRCLDAATGKELWTDQYEAQGATGAAGGYAGPRSSPTVAGGKVVFLGVRGLLSCYEAASGKKSWSNDDFTGAMPKFFTSSSPIVEDGLCIVQVGSEAKGGIVAYDLATGKEKWKWTDDGTAYSSPMLLTLGKDKVIVAETANNIVAIGLADGKLLWKTDFAVTGRGYNAATPMVDGQTVIYGGSGRPTKAVKLEKKGDELSAKELWSNKENPVIFNTPVLKNGLVFGLSERDNLFCINAEGKTAWTNAFAGGKRAGYGSIVDAGDVLFALNPSGQLLVFEPSAKEYKEIAKYKVGNDTYAYPIIAGNRIFVKDRDSVILWTIE